MRGDATEPRDGDFLDLVADATTTAAQSASARDAESAHKSWTALENAERSMAILEPILRETVDALRRLHVRPTKFNLGGCRVGGQYAATGTQGTTGNSEEVSAYGRSIGLFKFFSGSHCRGWRLLGPIDRGSSGIGVVLLEHRFRVWAYGAYGDRGLHLTAFVTGEPRCYVDESAVGGLVVVPDVFRRSLAEAVARLAGH